MTTYPIITQQITRQLDRLPFELQRRVLDFAENLTLSLPKGTAGKQLLRFAGAIRSDDIRAMTQAIKDSCERIDSDEW